MAVSPQLRVPGPTPIPERVQRAMARPLVNHKGPEFRELVEQLQQGLQWALGTTAPVLLLPSSGSGGLEAAVANLCQPGEAALFCTVGAFGQRWVAMGRAYGADVVELTGEWGAPVAVDDVGALLERHPDAAVVFLTHNETSTGVTNDLVALARVVKDAGRLLAVDSVSGAPCLPLEMDVLGCDVVVSASQKGWMAPPGVAMVACSERALARAAATTGPRWYFDFSRLHQFLQRRETPTTPAISVLFGLAEGLQMLREEGREAVWGRHASCAGAIRAAVSALGLRLLAHPDAVSDVVTAVLPPAGVEPDAVRAFLARLRERHGLVIAGGQGPYEGRLVRIGHLGAIDAAATVALVDAFEAGAREVGWSSAAAGAGLAAAQAALHPVPPPGHQRVA
ncbi:MAG TPA: alanine--glyoxylate aminotransferase family protein [Candidatus Micrarchaeia archaeon]|nr:alanine--glyoxylate aminotransferase family protein [Candidatus Micrarchaeia archaeon]